MRLFIITLNQVPGKLLFEILWVDLVPGKDDVVGGALLLLLLEFLQRVEGRVRAGHVLHQRVLHHLLHPLLSLQLAGALAVELVGQISRKKQKIL